MNSPANQPLDAIDVKILRELQADARLPKMVLAMPEVIACHPVSGDADFLLEVVVPDRATHEAILLRKQLSLPSVRDIRSNFAMRSHKAGGACQSPEITPCQFRRLDALATKNIAVPAVVLGQEARDHKPNFTRLFLFGNDDIPGVVCHRLAINRRGSGWLPDDREDPATLIRDCVEPIPQSHRVVLNQVDRMPLRLVAHAALLLGATHTVVKDLVRGKGAAPAFSVGP